MSPSLGGSSPPPHTAQRLLCQAQTQTSRSFARRASCFRLHSMTCPRCSCASRTRVDSTMCFCRDEPNLVHHLIHLHVCITVLVYPHSESEKRPVIFNLVAHMLPLGHAKWPAAVSSSKYSINSVPEAAFKAPRVGGDWLDGVSSSPTLCDTHLRCEDFNDSIVNQTKEPNTASHVHRQFTRDKRREARRAPHRRASRCQTDARRTGAQRHDASHQKGARRGTPAEACRFCLGSTDWSAR